MAMYMVLSTSRIWVGLPMPVMSMVICIAGESPVMSRTPLIGTLWPERSIRIEKRAVVILEFAALSRARKSALSTAFGALGDGFAADGVLAVAPCGSVAEAWLEPSPQAASEERASGSAATRAAFRRVRGRMGPPGLPEARPAGANEKRAAGPSSAAARSA